MKRSLVVAIAGVTAFLGLAESASAQRRASLEEGPIVRRKLLFRSSRFELNPRLGFTLGDSYKRNLLVGADINYYLTNEFGLGATGYFGAVQLDTDLLEQINATVDPNVTKDLSYASTQLLFDVHISYAPLYGKFAIFDTILNYDIHLVGGFGGAIIQAEGGAPSDKLSGFKPAPMLGGGVRVFVSDGIAVTLDLRDYLYSAADLQEGDEEPVTEFRNNFAMSLGVSFFFPGEVKVSR
jgi:outer membrane beta-barrel protein